MTVETFKGFVGYIHEKTGTNSRGAWSAYSVKLVDEHGNEDPNWYRFGFDKPPLEDDKSTDGKGSYVQFEAEKDGEGVYKYVQGSGTFPEAPARTAKASPAKRGGGNYRSGGGGGPKTKTSALFGEIGGYTTEDDVRRIGMSHAQEMAISTVNLLLENKALPVTGASTKAGESKRFKEIKAEIDKLTIEFYFDTATGRKVDTVQDSGLVTETAAELPSDDAAEVADESQVEIPAGPPADPDDAPDAPVQTEAPKTF